MSKKSKKDKQEMKHKLINVIQAISKILDTYLHPESIINIKVSSKIGSYDATIDSNGIVIECGYIPISKAS